MAKIGVCVVTYNQEEYISQAIESVLSQIINEHQVLLYIGNDASTDRTTEICEEYVHAYPSSIILLNNSKNLGLVANTLNVLTHIVGDGCEYVAMLDGDDYWCDNLKLQKQISFFEGNSGFGLCHTRVYSFVDGRLVKSSSPIPPCGDVFQKMGKFSIGNCSVVFRTSLLQYCDFKELQSQHFLSLDYVMYAIFSAHTKFGFINEYTSVWRRDHISISNPQSEEKQIAYLENDMKMWRYLGQLFPSKWPFDDASWESYKNHRVFSIAYRFNDYELAHSISSQIDGHGGISILLKKIIASNRILFRIVHLLRTQ